VHDHERDSCGLEHTTAARHPEHVGPAAAHPLIGLQRAAGNAAVAGMLEEDQPSPVAGVVGSASGRPLDEDTRDFMESRFSADFSDVRVHTGGRAADSAKAVQAHAYTVGNDVVFGSGQYAPETDSGKRMLAHELTHVVQQRSGPVAGTPAPGGIKVSDPADSFERAAEATADQVMSGGPTQAMPAASGGAQVQRQADEEEELQMSAVQRQAEEEEELQM
jgi:hypothetical protein